ncbi:MAG: HIT domain-containing protein [Desulfurococcaceae archaeon]
MRILWNPWRYDYIKQFSIKQDEGRKDCLFCALQRMKEDEALVVYKGNHAFVVLNAYPYNSGHLMIAPYAHVADLTKLDDSTSTEMVLLIRKSVKVLRKAFNPDGFNIGANIGRAAGAGVPDHFHVHVVPRWVGDANFMAIIAGTKPLPIGLREVYETVKMLWHEVDP